MAFNSYLLPNFSSTSPTTATPVGVGAPSSIAPMMPMATGNPSAVSRGTGFGSIGPDFSGLPASTVQGIMSDLGRLTYSLDGGGYRFRDGNYTGNLGAWHGSDPNANRLASQTYGEIGSLPTRNYGSLALERLYQTTGQRPAQGPSLTSRFGAAGIQGGYQGPFTFPGYNPMSQYGG